MPHSPVVVPLTKPFVNKYLNYCKNFVNLINLEDFTCRDFIYNSNDDGFGRAVGELNFAAPSEDEAEFPSGAYLKKGKVSRQDPMSHRIIEKRRRDRMNNCLADLSRLIPPEYLKKGRGRVEKTEIIEMAIRHLKYLQERVNATERQGEQYRAGYQEAVTEAVRYLAEVQGYGPGDGLSAQLAAHLHRHREHITKGVPTDLAREKVRSQPGSSSETASSSSSSHGYVMKSGGVIAQAPPPAPPAPSFPVDVYEQELYQPMDCDRLSMSQLSTAPESDPGEKPLPLDGFRKLEPAAALRAVRKLDHDDYLQSYKFKNSIGRRFSRSQDSEVTESGRVAPHCKVYNHKRRRAAKPAPSTSTSNSGSTEDARDTSPQDTSSESPHHHDYEKPLPPPQYVPVFALNALGKYYVPLSVDYACLTRNVGPYDVLDPSAVHLAAPLHPVTIHVNFQPCMNYHVKREPTDRDWRAT